MGRRKEGREVERGGMVETEKWREMEQAQLVRCCVYIIMFDDPHTYISTYYYDYIYVVCI